jgi:hypothetical protein
LGLLRGRRGGAREGDDGEAHDEPPNDGDHSKFLLEMVLHD